jgi:hypothetical protein
VLQVLVPKAEELHAKRIQVRALGGGQAAPTAREDNGTRG